jgi:transposase
MNQHRAIGIDLAKRVFQVCVVVKGNVQVNKALKRAALVDFLRQQPACRVYMEACGGSHYWARQCRALGHEVFLIAPQFVTPFRKGHKTDANDALAIVEAGGRPKMRFVPVKGLEQQDLQSLHRIRNRLIKQRTQLINQTHGLLQEYGIVSGRGQKALKQAVAEALEDGENELTPLLRELLDEQINELHGINQRIQQLDRRLTQQAQALPACRALLAVEGIGPMVATQLYSALGDGKAFANGRQAAAYLGLTPRQYSSGGKVTLAGIGRTGQVPLKAALIRGAHAVIKTLGTKTNPKSQWLRALVDRRGHNKAAVALANKTVRTAWALLYTGQAYVPDHRHLAIAA